MLDYYVENPQRWLDEDGEKQLKAVHTVLMRKFTELAFAQSADSDQRPNRAVEGDEIDLGRVTDADLQKSLLEASDDPF